MMQTLIKGFSKQDIVSVDWIVATVKRVPRHHLRNITAIVYDPGRRFQRSYFNPKPVNYSARGQYDLSPVEHILVYRFETPAECQHILFHEIGHHVYNRVITSSLKKQWVTGIYPNSKHVSEYASTNASEDFAESYAFFYTNPKRLARIREKFKFIRQLQTK